MRMKKIILSLFLILAVYFLVFSPHGLVKIISLRIRLWRVREQQQINIAREVILERETKLLESDKEYIKRAGREKFGIE